MTVRSFSTEWGNMSWYSAVSKDLIKWTPHGQQPALKPDQHYDREGIFTGYILPRGPRGEKNIMTAIYTSVRVIGVISILL